MPDCANPIFYFVRHGENPANVTGEFSYKLVDYPLTKKGQEQSAKTAASLADTPVRAVFTSPLRRARETAEAIAAVHRLTPIVIEEFRELNVGDLEIGPPSREKWAIHDRIMTAWLAGDYAPAFPSGEDFHSALARMRRGLARVLAHGGRHPVVVGHFGLFNVSMTRICDNFSRGELERRGNPNCAVTRIRFSTTDPASISGEVLEWASTSHL